MGVVDMKEVSLRYQVNILTAYRWAKEGKIPAFKVGKVWRVRERDLEELETRGTGGHGTKEH